MIMEEKGINEYCDIVTQRKRAFNEEAETFFIM